MNASGSFDVKLEPQKVDNPQAEAASIGRLSIHKKFQGAIDGVSNGEMLARRDDQQNGAYVALERVTGSLNGRNGSFVLMHSAVMMGGVPANWSVAVVPGSGTEQLAGLSGTMKITIDDSGHGYDFQYTLPES